MYDFSEDDIEIEKEDESGDSVFIDYDIASYPSDNTLQTYVQMWDDKDIIIPDYQREFVWTINQSSLLIDSFLSGLPVPPVFLYINEENKSIVIDGQQRILSAIFFMEGYFGKENEKGNRQVFRLTGLGKKNPNDKKTFMELSESQQRKIKQSVLRSINIRQLSPVGESTSAYHIFERLNTGGTPLRPQEIRNCVFNGEFNKILGELNKDENWRKILGRINPDKHQKDIEFILRIFALINSVSDYEKPIKEFLNKAMKKHESADTKKSKSFKDVFPKATKLIVDQLGEKPFHLRGPLNISALDSVMVVILENFEKVDKSKLGDKYLILKESKDFIDSTSINTTDHDTIKKRMATVRKILIG